MKDTNPQTQSFGKWLELISESQEISFTEKEFKEFLDFSEKKLQDAYSRMNMPEQKWTRGTSNEVDYILEMGNVNPESKILDIGCGQGRHSLELSKRGFKKVTSIDFSESNISKAQNNSINNGYPATFLCADARKYKTGIKSDLILCVYDVIGSFRDNKDNKSIIRTIKTNLKKGGRAIISVMNMELTQSIAVNHESLKSNPKSLLKLPPSNTMEASGNVFNPEYFLINSDDGLVYRKEQFSEGGEVFAEYVIADKRYTLVEIIQILTDEGFKIIDSRYVQAGHWDVSHSATDSKAKEILLTVEL